MNDFSAQIKKIEDLSLNAWPSHQIQFYDGWGMFFALLFASLPAQGLKLIFRVPRPWNLDNTFVPVSAAVQSAGGYLFPSIHSQSAASLATTLSLYYKKTKARTFFCLLMVLVLFSRMYLGCHTPSDVAAGAAIGIVISLIVFRSFTKVTKGTVLLSSFVIGKSAKEKIDL